MARALAALEIGTTEVRVLVAQPREDKHILITGVGIVPSRGIRKGQVMDVKNAVTCVKQALAEAEEQADASIQEVLLVCSGGLFRQIVNRGMVSFPAESVVTDEDRLDAIRNARAVNLAPEFEVLHAIPQYFYTRADLSDGVTNPVGMNGTRLSVDMLILYAERMGLNNLVTVAEEAGLDVYDVAFGGLCSALGVLTPSQREGGALLIDLGGGTTDYVLYQDNLPLRAGGFAVGGDHVTHDISIGLSLSTPQAERLKRKHGEAMVDLLARDRKVTVPPDGGFRGGDVRSRDLNTIVHARMQETFELIKSALGEELFRRGMRAGVVLTGGGARVPRVTELASQVFEMPCHIGLPKDVSGLSTPGDNPEFAAATGMIRHVLQTDTQSPRGFSIRNLFKPFLSKK
ncbi:MAG: cell division protein FtsA [Verrucomicrobia bacterium]|nr:cell division protein FtsA [Verrucomicrobiota bacterium]